MRARSWLCGFLISVTISRMVGADDAQTKPDVRPSLPAGVAVPLPPTLLAPTPVPKPGSGPVLNTDEAVGVVRSAIRRKQYGLAESTMATLPADATGYRDLVTQLSSLRVEQAATYEALAAAWREKRAGDLAQLALSSGAFADLSQVTNQVKAYVDSVETAYDRPLQSIAKAIEAKDFTTAKTLLQQIPDDERMLPPGALAKRRNALTALAQGN